jgi:hypothetical protein
MSRFDDLKSKILYEIWSYVQSAESLSTYTITELQNRILEPDSITGMTRAALESLVAEGALLSDGREYWISEAGITSIESEIGPPNTHSDETEEAEPSMSSGSESIPAADRVVALDHNSDPYRDAVRALDEAVAAFKEDHFLDNEWGPEKGTLLRVIGEGRELLKEGQVRVATIFSTIVMPLRILSHRYQDAIAEGMAKAVVEQMIHLAGKGISAVLKLLGLK